MLRCRFIPISVNCDAYLSNLLDWGCKMIIQNSTNGISTSEISTSGVSTTPTPEPSVPVSDTSITAQSDVSKPPTQQELKNAVDTLNKAVKENHTNLDISVDQNTKDIVVKVVDTSNGDVITQFPSKVALAISASIDNKQKGVFLNSKA